LLVIFFFCKRQIIQTQNQKKKVKSNLIQNNFWSGLWIFNIFFFGKSTNEVGQIVKKKK